MPAPSTALTTLRPDLGSMMEFDLEANRNKFIANRVLPILNVDMPADVFGKIPLEQLLKRANVTRASNGDYREVEWSFTSDSYATDEYGLAGKVDQRNARKYANYIDAESSTARFVLHLVLLEAEFRVKDLLFPGSYTPTGVVNEWDDNDNGTPIDDVKASKFRIFAATGIWPNAIVFNEKVFENLRHNGQILERIAASGAGDKIKAKDVTTAMLAACFNLDHVVVAGAVSNSADEGQTAVPGHIWSDEYAAVGRIAERMDDIIEPCVGHTFHWAGDGSQPGGLIESYWDDRKRADMIRVRHEVDEKVKYTEMWDVLENITTA